MYEGAHLSLSHQVPHQRKFWILASVNQKQEIFCMAGSPRQAHLPSGYKRLSSHGPFILFYSLTFLQKCSPHWLKHCGIPTSNQSFQIVHLCASLLVCKAQMCSKLLLTSLPLIYLLLEPS